MSSHGEATTNHTATKSGSGRGVLIAIFLLVALALVVVRFRFFSPTTPEAPTATASAPAPVQQQVVVKVGRQNTLYRFDETGCIEKFLRGGWGSYPKGGKIRFVDMKTGRIVHYDEPGKDTGASLPAGDYKICKDAPSAWGVEIYE